MELPALIREIHWLEWEWLTEDNDYLLSAVIIAQVRRRQ